MRNLHSQTLEMIGIEIKITEVIEETSRIETGHMTQVEGWIGIIEEDLFGI